MNCWIQRVFGRKFIIDGTSEVRDKEKFLLSLNKIRCLLFGEFTIILDYGEEGKNQIF